MRIRNLLARIAGRAVERPTPVIVAAVLVALIGAVAALRARGGSEPRLAGRQGLVHLHGDQDFYKQFGDEPVEVLVKGDLRQLLLTSNLGKLLALESCLSGRRRAVRCSRASRRRAPCAAIAKLDPSAVVFGPATFLNQFAIEANNLYQKQPRRPPPRRSARGGGRPRWRRSGATRRRSSSRRRRPRARQVAQEFQQQSLTLAARYGQQGLPSLTTSTYVESVICDPGLPACTPKARLAAIVPSPNAALISVRLRPDLSDAQRSRGDLAVQAGDRGPGVPAPEFSSFGTQPSYVVSGVPVVFEGLAQELSTQIFILLAAALARDGDRAGARVPLAAAPSAAGIALGAAGITFGFLSLIGGSLTMASIAVLPVLIGLSVDYAIQFQARFVEAVREGSSPPRAAVEAAARGGPVIATACLATAGGLLRPAALADPDGAWRSRCSWSWASSSRSLSR